MKMIKIIFDLLFLAGSQNWRFAIKPMGYPSFNVKVEGKGSPVILVCRIGCSSEVWNETVKVLSMH
jgi:hypothetical protein